VDIDKVFYGYVECALWASTDDDGKSLDGLGIELESSAVASMRNDVEDFCQANATDIANLDPAQVGHDFWLTRNQHGAGFWDRGLGAVGDRLTKAAHAYGESDIYQGDDGNWYVS
jgi:hypothetical protein